MVVIRLARGGAKKRPFFQIVAVDKRTRRDSGAVIEKIGYFNPIATGKEQRLEIKRERVGYWIGVGAQLSATVNTLVKEWDKSKS